MDDFVRAVARADAPASLTPGQTLEGNYELVERLGGGGMGVVFRARDLRLGRDVAVKVLRPAGAAKGEHLRKLFEREARATAQLLHPNIVTLHHVGEHAGLPTKEGSRTETERVPYLVLELLSGETLASRLARRGRLPVADALAILDAVLAALAFAHERGVLHRDLKPNNVFVTVDERVKVLDFGVALSLDTDPGPVTRAAGTPGYMAPEQRQGLDQDARTDVWAAALLLVECLVGRRVDEAEAQRALDELASVPAIVREQLAAALATDPAKRPATANELRLALARAHERLAPAIDTSASRRRLRFATLGALLVAVLALGAAAFAFRSDHHAPPATPAAHELVGLWSVNFGVMMLEVSHDGRVYGVYEHDQGILSGHYENGLFLGRWCELPTRRPKDDAGNLQLQFARNGERLRVDGRWTYGDSPDAQWHANEAGFFGAKLPSRPRDDLRARLARREACP